MNNAFLKKTFSVGVDSKINFKPSPSSLSNTFAYFRYKNSCYTSDIKQYLPDKMGDGK
jgi:hypothetical protein